MVSASDPVIKRGARMAAQQSALSYDDYARGIQTLTPEEQLSLIELISANLKMNMGSKARKKGLNLTRLKRRNLLTCEPDELVDLKVWEWNEPNNL